MWWILLGALALGANGTPEELMLEHGRIALEHGDVMTARRHAMTLLAETPTDSEARQLYLDALQAGGMGPRGLAEVAGLNPAPAEYAEALATLVKARQDGDEPALIEGAQAIEESWPDRPDLLVELFEVNEVKGKLKRYRLNLVERVRAATDIRRDPVFLYRSRRLLLAAGAHARLAADVLAATGEVRPPDVPPMRIFHGAEYARVLTNAEGTEAPMGLRAAEAGDVLDRAAEIAFRENRYDRAIALWAAVEPATVWSATGEARAYLETDRPKLALEYVDEAALVATDPWPDDISAIDVASRARVWVDALELRAPALEGLAHLVQALVEQGTADQLANRTRESALSDRLKTSALPEFQRIDALYRAPAPESALLAAENALEAGEFEDAITHSVHATFLYSWALAGDWRVECARARAVQARASRGLDNGAAERSAWAVALLLRPEAPVQWWLEAAQSHERAGQMDAAFARYATAALRSEDPSSVAPAIARTHIGLGEAAEAAEAVALPIPKELARSGKARITREITYRFTAAQPVGHGSGANIGTAATAGSRMPAWSTPLPEGGIASSQSLQGRTVVLMFWSSACTPCMLALEQAGDLARDLRQTGRDVAVVAVSMDQERQHFEEVRRLSRHRVTLAHNPDLGFRLGVRDVPTTWIIDPRGTVQYYSEVWPGARAFERTMRRALQE